MSTNKCNELNELNLLINLHSTCWQNSILTMLWLSNTTYKKICSYVKVNEKPFICEGVDIVKHDVDKKPYLPEKYDKGLCDRFINTIINYWKQFYKNTGKEKTGKELLYNSLATLIDYKDLIYNYNVAFNKKPKFIRLHPYDDKKTTRINNEDVLELKPDGYFHDIFFFLLFVTVYLYNTVYDVIVNDKGQLHDRNITSDCLGWLFYVTNRLGGGAHMTTLFFNCNDDLQYHDSNRKATEIIIIKNRENIKWQIENYLKFDNYDWAINKVYTIKINTDEESTYKKKYEKYYTEFNKYYADEYIQVTKLDSMIEQKVLSFNNHKSNNHTSNIDSEMIRTLIKTYDFIAIQNINTKLFEEIYYGDGQYASSNLKPALAYNYLYNDNLLCLFEKNPNIIAEKFDSIYYIKNNKQQIIYININIVNKQILDSIIKIVNNNKKYKIVICLGNNTELKMNNFNPLINLKTTKNINVYISQQKTFGEIKYVHSMGKWYDSIIVINSNINKANIITHKPFTTLHRPLEIKITNPMKDPVILWKLNIKTKTTDLYIKFLIDNELAILKNELKCTEIVGKNEDANYKILNRNNNEGIIKNNKQIIEQIIDKYKDDFNIIMRVFDIMSVFSLSCKIWEEKYKELWKKYSNTEDITEETIKLFYIKHQFAKIQKVKKLSDELLSNKLKILQHQMVLSDYIKPIFEKMSIDDKYTMINKYDIEEIKQNAELLNICFLINEPLEDITASIIVSLYNISIPEYYKMENHSNLYVVYNHLVIKNVTIQTASNNKRIFIISCHFYTGPSMNIIYIHLDKDYDRYNNDIIGKTITRNFTHSNNLYTKEDLYDYIRELINYSSEDNEMYIKKVNDIKTRLKLTINISNKFILYSNKLDYIYISDNKDEDGNIRLTIKDINTNYKSFNFTYYNTILKLYNIEYTNSSPKSRPISNHIPKSKAKSKAKQKYHKYKLKYIKLKAKLFNL
jgi:hypothetical protein